MKTRKEMVNNDNAYRIAMCIKPERAKAFRDGWGSGDRAAAWALACDAIALNIADALCDVEGFDRQRFLIACGAIS